MNSIVRVLVLFIILVSGTTIVFAQDARIKKMSSETDDSIEFQISVDKSFITRGEDIAINYVVKNKNKKSVFLVIQSPLLIQVKDTWVLKIIKPITLPDDHKPYNYDFIKIYPNKTYSGNLVIKAEHYRPGQGYVFTDAAIQVEFSYLFDISSQKGCKEKDYQYFCLSDLYEEAKSLTIGNLVIDINDK